MISWRFPWTKEDRIHRNDLTPPQMSFTKVAFQRQASYKRKWWLHTLIYNGVSFVIVAGAAVVSVLVNIPSVPTLILTVIGGVVAVGGAFSNFYNFRERRQIYRLGFLQLEQEINSYNLSMGVYTGLESVQAFRRFHHRVEHLHLKMTQEVFKTTEEAFKQLDLEEAAPPDQTRDDE